MTLILSPFTLFNIVFQKCFYLIGFTFIFSLCELLKYSIGISIPQPISWIRASLEWNPFGRIFWRAVPRAGAGRQTSIRATSTGNTVPDTAATSAAAAKSYSSSFNSFYFCFTYVLRWIAELNWKTYLSFYVFVEIFIKIDTLNSSLFGSILTGYSKYGVLLKSLLFTVNVILDVSSILTKN